MNDRKKGTCMNDKALNHAVIKELQEILYQMYGPLLASRDLWKILGFASPDAYRQARNEGRLPVPEFSLVGRKGYFSLTQDIIHWLAEQRSTATINMTLDNHLNNKEDSNE
ncbi:MAG: hypothetical protein ACRCXK_13720 [Wohlfahrtiimonas sp.]